MERVGASGVFEDFSDSGLADFYKGFRRAKGQEFVAYDMEFTRHGQRLEEIGAGISGVTKA